MQALKSIGNYLLGIIIFVGIVIVPILLLTLGAGVAFKIQPFLNGLSGVLLIINIVALIIAIAPKARGVSGLIIFTSSYVYGLGAWIFGLAVTLAFWGWLAVFIGLILGGIGVVPIGMLASILNGNWGIFWSLFMSIILTYGTRIIGTLLVSSADNHSQYGEDRSDDEIIDLEPEIKKRTWKDIE